MICPICNYNKFKLILRKDMLDKKYNLVYCKSCSLVFINPLPSQEDLTEYYNKDYTVPEYQQKKVIEKSRKVLNLLKKIGVKKDSKIFELGASHGFFLNEAKKRGFKPFGVELSKKATLNAKKRFGISIQNKIFEESSYYKKKDYFDVATSFDVLEHLIDPNPVLNGLKNILKSEGKLVLTVPNINSYEFKLYGRHWEWLSPPAHLFYYSPKTIKKLLLKHGFEIVHLETYKGDTAGNLLFHSYLASRQLVFYSLKSILGKKKLLEMRDNIGKSIDEKGVKNKKEFSGLSGLIYYISNLFNPILNPIQEKGNKKGKGASLLVIAKKK